MAVGLPSAARRLNSWQVGVRKSSLRAVVGFAWLLNVYIYVCRCPGVYEAFGAARVMKSGTQNG